MMRPLIQNVLASIRASASTRWITVQQLRLETRTRLNERRAARWYARHAIRGTRPIGDPSSDTSLEEDVLRSIARHPEGIRALDIGNELGVDWRRVPVVSRRLVERGVIEQVGEDFYPIVGKVS